MEKETAREKKKKRDGRYCCAGGPNLTSCQNNTHTDGISMHQFPKDPTIRRKWVKFVQRHRADFDESRVTNYTSNYTAHFEEDCFARKISLDLGEASNMYRFLTRGSVPTRDSVIPQSSEVLTITERRKRQVSVSKFNSVRVFAAANCDVFRSSNGKRFVKHMGFVNNISFYLIMVTS